jgi:hypothetical protein
MALDMGLQRLASLHQSNDYIEVEVRKVHTDSGRSDKRGISHSIGDSADSSILLLHRGQCLTPLPGGWHNEGGTFQAFEPSLQAHLKDLCSPSAVDPAEHTRKRCRT